MTSQRVPISSFQAVLQTDEQCYAGCVIPSCAPWIDTLETATEFAIYREYLLLDGSTIDVAVVRCPLDTLQIDQGPTNQTASLSGYFDAFESVASPSASLDRTMTGVRSISTYSSGARVRCSIDPLLTPSTRAFYAGTSMVVSYMNLYVSQGQASAQAYMDIGERIT